MTASVTRLAARVRALPAVVSPGPARPRRPAAGVMSGCVPCVAAARRSGSDVMLWVCVVCVVHVFLLVVLSPTVGDISLTCCAEKLFPSAGSSFPGTGPRQVARPGARSQEHLPGQDGRPGRCAGHEAPHPRPDRARRADGRVLPSAGPAGHAATGRPPRAAQGLAHGGGDQRCWGAAWPAASVRLACPGGEAAGVSAGMAGAGLGPGRCWRGGSFAGPAAALGR